MPRRTGPSIADVARLAGVSAQTVSRVSTGSGAVREQTRARVLAAMAQLDYAPNRAARALRSGSFATIGLLAHRFERTGEALITEAVVEAAEAEGYAVTLLGVRTPSTGSWEDAALRLTRQAVDGLVAVRAEHEAGDALALPPGLPVVVTDSRLVGRYPAVVADQVGGVRAATEHLLGLGHRRIAHLAGPPESEPARLREAAWRATLEEAGLPAPAVVRGDWTAASGYARGLRLPPGVSAVVCANDEIAFGLLRALHETGRRVPQDVSVVGFDGIGLSEFAAPPLTTVRQDFPAMGRALVRLLLERVRGEDDPGGVVVPTSLVVRESTAPPGV